MPWAVPWTVPWAVPSPGRRPAAQVKPGARECATLYVVCNKLAAPVPVRVTRPRHIHIIHNPPHRASVNPRLSLALSSQLLHLASYTLHLTTTASSSTATLDIHPYTGYTAYPTTPKLPTNQKPKATRADAAHPTDGDNAREERTRQRGDVHRRERRQA